MTSTPAAVAKAKTTAVSGLFYRHSSVKHAALTGRPIGGRWAPTGAFAVLYLGRPPASVTVEAYRHLVDPVEGMTAAGVGPSLFTTCQLDVNNVVDLRDSVDQELVGLTPVNLASDVGDYEACQRIDARAFQLGRSGVIAPAATGFGETLALFTERISAAAMPRVTDTTLWESLPRDPRDLRLVEGEVAE